MKIKVCGLTLKENIHDVAGLGPDLMGLIFYPRSPRYVVGKLEPFDLAGLPAGVLKAGVFVNADIKEMIAIFRKYDLDLLQLHGDESPELCKELKDKGIQIIKAFNLYEGFNFASVNDYIPFCRYLLFDTHSGQKGGSGRKFNWKIISDYTLDHPFFLSGGIAPGDAGELLSFHHPSLAGVDVNSRFENSPGIKDIGKLKVFINELRIK